MGQTMSVAPQGDSTILPANLCRQRPHVYLPEVADYGFKIAVLGVVG